MKLYYKPGACSLASHIVLQEIGAPFTVEAVDTDAGRTDSGADFRAINVKGVVPVLALDKDDVLTEGPAILQYLADSAPEVNLLPKSGTRARAKVMEHLTYVSSELHKSFNPLFRSSTDDAGKEAARTAVSANFDHIETVLADGRRYLVDDRFSIADSYLFVVSNWANFTGIDLQRWPQLAAFVGRVAARPATQTALKAEGLLAA